MPTGFFLSKVGYGIHGPTEQGGPLVGGAADPTECKSEEIHVQNEVARWCVLAAPFCAPCLPMLAHGLVFLSPGSVFAISGIFLEFSAFQGPDLVQICVFWFFMLCRLRLPVTFCHAKLSKRHRPPQGELFPFSFWHTNFAFLGFCVRCNENTFRVGAKH